LASLGAALVSGRASDARALTGVVAAMGKRVEEERAATASARAAAIAGQQARRKKQEDDLIERYRYAAFLAYCMVHNPGGAPAIFVDAVAEQRRALFGEGDAESLAAARERARESRRYFMLDEADWEAALARTAPL
jgi:hypothetical protein